MSITYKSITPYNDKGQRHGLWEVYFDDTLWYKRFFHNGNRVGYEELCHYHNGKMKDKTYNI